MTFNSVLKTVLIMAVVSSFTLASAYDFEVNNLQYTITSDSTVKVSGQSYWDINAIYDTYDFYNLIHYHEGYSNKESFQFHVLYIS